MITNGDYKDQVKLTIELPQVAEDELVTPYAQVRMAQLYNATARHLTVAIATGLHLPRILLPMVLDMVATHLNELISDQLALIERVQNGEDPKAIYLGYMESNAPKWFDDKPAKSNPFEDWINKLDFDGELGAE